MVVFEERGNRSTRRKPLGAEKRTNKLNPHITPESNPGRIGGRRVLSPLRHPCTPTCFSRNSTFLTRVNWILPFILYNWLIWPKKLNERPFNCLIVTVSDYVTDFPRHARLIASSLRRIRAIETAEKVSLCGRFAGIYLSLSDWPDSYALCDLTYTYSRHVTHPLFALQKKWFEFSTVAIESLNLPS